MWEENQRLKERVAYLERSNNRREETIINLRNEQQLDLYKSVIDEVREFIKENVARDVYYLNDDCIKGEWIMQEPKKLIEIIDKVGNSDE